MACGAKEKQKLISCRRIYGGIVEGELIVSRKNFSFLGDVNPDTGRVVAEDSDIYRKSISGKIFAFPSGRGSTVGTYVLLRMRKSRTSPIAIINEHTEPIIAVGAIISEITLVDKVDLSLLKTGDRIRINADKGYIEILNR